MRILESASTFKLVEHLGSQVLSVSTCTISDIDQSLNTLTFVRFASGLSENKHLKLLSDNDKYSRDLRPLKLDGIFPLNSLDERSRTRSLFK